MIRLGIVGATGKMGQTVMKYALEDPMFLLCSTICSKHSKQLYQTSHKPLGLVFNDFCDREIDVIIDFSTPEGIYQAALMKKPLVCGTTGLTENDQQFLRDLSKHIPVLYSPNFSLGMALCFTLFEQLKNKVKNFSHIHLCEKHHQDKRDAPSGTALQIANLLNIPKDEIHFERTKDTIFHHQVEFFLNKEKVHIQHEAFSRESFALGALSAAKFLFNKPAGMYGLKDLWD